MELAQKSCIPCSGDVPPLSGDEAATLLEELGNGWSLNAAGHLEKAYTFADFTGAMGFAQRLGIIADLEGHHPDLHVSWGRCVVEIWTHAIDGLSESDFILAAKASRALSG
jgi:4a-hydroxytetrahydrobiopterin dehydratase